VACQHATVTSLEGSTDLEAPGGHRERRPATTLLLLHHVAATPRSTGSPSGYRGRRRRAAVVRGEPVLEAHLDAASLALAGVAERERLLASPHGALRLALPRRVAAAARPRVRVQDLPVALRPRHRRRPLDGVAAVRAHHDGAALVGGLGAAVVPVRAVRRAEEAAAAVALEGEEVELVAVGLVAVRAQVGERLRATTRHYRSSLRLQAPSYLPSCRRPRVLGFFVRRSAVGSVMDG